VADDRAWSARPTWWRWSRPRPWRPILLFAPFAGALADLLDRRSVLLAAQLWMCAARSALAALSACGWLTPALLLLLTFALGAGAALNGPAWQVAVREIVPASDLPAAVTLNAIGFNIARAWARRWAASWSPPPGWRPPSSSTRSPPSR
jgi:MFS family permease